MGCSSSDHTDAIAADIDLAKQSPRVRSDLFACGVGSCHSSAHLPACASTCAGAGRSCSRNGGKRPADDVFVSEDEEEPAESWFANRFCAEQACVKRILEKMSRGELALPRSTSALHGSRGADSTRIYSSVDTSYGSWIHEPAQRRSQRENCHCPLHVVRTMDFVPSQRMQTVIENLKSINEFYDMTGKELGRGFFGSVRRAKALGTGVTRAVKAIPKIIMIDKIDHLKREIEITKMVDHPNIIKLHEIFEDEQQIYFVLELCLGGTLHTRLDNAHAFDERRAALIFCQIMRAVNYLQKSSIIHRDLKPENCLITDTGSLTWKNSLKITDFGLSRTFRHGQLFDRVVGTPSHMAPEVLARKYGRECDFWSCGVILFTLLCGELPFCGETEDETREIVKQGRYEFSACRWVDVSQSGLSLVGELLDKNPQTRLNASDALLCKWLVVNGPEPEVISFKADLVKNLRHFRNLNKFKRAALQLIVSQLREDQICLPRQTFVALDHDGDGLLTIEEVRKVLQNSKGRTGSEKYASNLDQLLKDLDVLDQEQQQAELQTSDSMKGVVFTVAAAEGDEANVRVTDRRVAHASATDVARPQDMGHQETCAKRLADKLNANFAEDYPHYTYTEFLAATFDRQKFIREDVCRIAFNLLDSNGDGFISKEELSGHLLGRLSENELAQLVQAIDENGDGKIDFQEFMRMMLAGE